ncbi:MAG: hypothetical protein J6S62_05585, partial [Bacteroidales bacterium]|nr:hypothetical protein [Bacteroidales bacterium]
MIRRLFALSVVLLVLAAGCKRNPEGKGEPTPQKDTIPILGFFTEDYNPEYLKVKEGETFTGLMGRLGLGAKDAYTLAERLDSIFDVRRMRAGNDVEAYYSKDSTRTLEYVVYHNDRVRSTIFRTADSLYAWT